MKTNATSSTPSRRILALAVASFAVSILCPAVAHAGYITITETSNAVTIGGGDYEAGLTANGQNIDGASITVSLGTPINFSGGIFDYYGNSAASQRIYVLPFSGAGYAISDLNFSNTDSTGIIYHVNGTYDSAEHIAVPNGASTIVAGDMAGFSTPYSANGLITSTVPEPGTWALLAVGTGALGLALRRRAVLPG